MTVKYLGKVLISEMSKMISHAEEGNYVIHNICILLYSNVKLMETIGTCHIPTYIRVHHTHNPPYWLDNDRRI